MVAGLGEFWIQRTRTRTRIRTRIETCVLGLLWQSSLC
jgi:hypothetical protein